MMSILAIMFIFVGSLTQIPHIYSIDDESNEIDLIEGIISFGTNVESTSTAMSGKRQIFKFHIDDDLDSKVYNFCSIHYCTELYSLKLLHQCKNYRNSYLMKTKIRNVAVIMGTRPDVIKLSLLVTSLYKWKQHLNLTVINTGQHKDMLYPMFEIFNITPHVNLELMAYSKSGMTSFISHALRALEKVFLSLNLDAIIVQGDTNTALAGAMAAFYLNIPLIHIEAGLRTNNLRAPFPEEYNRKIISISAALSLAPTVRAKEALLKEGVNPESIMVVGNTVIDAADFIMTKRELASEELQYLESLPLSLTGPRHIIVSTHRRESFGVGIQTIVESVAQLANIYTNRKFIFLVHLNPNVRDPILASLSHINNIVLLDPVPYAPFLRLLTTAALILTDSGGMQEEAAFFGVPCLVLRDVTERQEGVDIGVAKLLPLKTEVILREVQTMLKYTQAGGKRPSSKVYGDGNAVVRSSCRIALFLQLDTRSCEGEASQEWIYNSGAPLLPRTIKEDDKALYLMQQFGIGQSSAPYFKPYRKPDSVTVIITQYKRNTTIAQLQAIRSQSAVSQIDAILIYQNEQHITLDFLKYFKWSKSLPPIQIIQSPNRNFKFHGRFTVPLLLDTEYTVIFDDDTIPQSGWIEHAIHSSKLYNAIVGAVGMIVGADAQYFMIAPIEYPLEVDYVGHSWVFKTDWIKYLWQEHVPSWECCEDIGFSASAWLHGRIKTIIPAMPKAAFHLWGDSSKAHHKDGKQSFTRPIPAKMRWPVTRYWIDQGWIPTVLRDSILGDGHICAEPLPRICLETYELLFRDKLLQTTTTTGLEKNSQLAVKNFITVSTDPLTYVFGEDATDTSAENSKPEETEEEEVVVVDNNKKKSKSGSGEKKKTKRSDKKKRSKQKKNENSEL